MGWEGPVTHRQLLVWSEYFRLEMDRPSRTDFYLMRVGFESFYSQREYPKTIDLEPFRLKFSSKEPGVGAKEISKHLSKAQASAIFKSRFAMALGLDDFGVSKSEVPESEPDSESLASEPD